MLKDCIISKDIPFGMYKNEYGKFVYKYWEKPKNRLLLPNLSCID